MTKIIVSVIIIWLLITIIVMLYSNSKKIESINKKIDDLSHKDNTYKKVGNFRSTHLLYTF